MKILHLIDSGGFYGAEAVLLELIKEQRRQGDDAQLCSIGTYQDGVKQIEKKCIDDEIPVHVFKMKAGFNILGGIRILNFAKKNNIEILHSHGYKSNILMGLFPRFYRATPLIVTTHGWTSSQCCKKIWLYEQVDAFFLKFRSVIIPVSKKMVDHPYLKGLSHLCSVIENGISASIPTLSDDSFGRKISKLRTEGYQVIGTIGRLSNEKGYDFLIKSFAKCSQKFVLVIIGDGPLMSELKILATSLGVKDRVVFFGYAENASQYLALFDVYVNSSRTEGTPITLLEAMRAKVPIVARSVGGNAALLQAGKYGLLVNQEIQSLMSDAIAKAVLSGQDKTEEAYNAFIKNHTVMVMANKYKDAYSKILK